jgi:hypothetical protein
VEGVFGNEKHTSWHTFENSLAAGEFTPVTSHTLFPRRIAFSSRFKSSNEELSEWENSIRGAIEKRGKRRDILSMMSNRTAKF